MFRSAARTKLIASSNVTRDERPRREVQEIAIMKHPYKWLLIFSLNKSTYLSKTLPRIHVDFAKGTHSGLFDKFWRTRTLSNNPEWARQKRPYIFHITEQEHLQQYEEMLAFAGHALAVERDYQAIPSQSRINEQRQFCSNRKRRLVCDDV